MKRELHHIVTFFRRVRMLLPAWLLLLTGTACTEQADDPTATDGRIATLRLLVPLPDAATRVDIGDDYEADLTAEESAIHTLRVVVYSLRDGNNATTLNRLFTAAELTAADTDGDGIAELTLSGIPTGTAQVCAIANEASIGRNYSNILDMQKEAVEVGSYSKVLIVDEKNTYFPKRGTQLLDEAGGPKGLPMSWMKKDYDVTGNTTLDVELERCVAKIRMQIQNNFSADITLKEVSFGEFFGNSFYLFRETSLDVPGQTYQARTFKDEVTYTIPPGGNEVLILYFYPSFAWTTGVTASPYTVGYKTEKGQYPLMAFLHADGERYNSIPRNKQVNIGVTLSGKTNVQIDFEVVPWTEVEVNVPDFN
ncbi:FimB/Mfa2 family fimbrial subunit [Mediterranea massiliensis]|uniref:FimB/Mfa2 family fimbrial subunit n=1 Tax=Mediterranea massiliensis TaxID=1841865 RepID=A0ABS2E2M1_9BACT|nr:FimB/Mfa2 family fimbrial subunit [Mediterranea massiliensis]MBM6735895.1 FimB/Mfa2 family fimbrial subunit [Mediterranea massiliensis]